MASFLHINPNDNVVVALTALKKGDTITVEGNNILLANDVERGHKIAIAPIAKGQNVVKYGFPIGHAKQDIQAGDWVHLMNLATNLSEEGSFVYTPSAQTLAPIPTPNFQGYLRPDGRAGIRNEVWIIPTVGCVNEIAEQLTKENAHLVTGSVEGIHAFPHPYGCSQMGDDHDQTAKLLAALVNHPNAGAVLVLGLGCENNNIASFKKALGSWDEDRVKFLETQKVEDELEAGGKILEELCAYASQFQRQLLPASKLVVGMKCGGSDGLSGITANPTVGAFSDRMIAMGGSTLLTEVPEMFGAEQALLNRSSTAEVFTKADAMIARFKQYFVDHGQVVYENPSPGNKEGGISTLEDKSLGCVQKGGTAPIVDVLDYAEPVKTNGLSLMYGPGNDLVSATALAAAGAHMVLFTTGRGTPFGAPVPTVKISSNTALFKKKPGWIDFDAGPVADGEPLQESGKRLMDLVLQTASGETKTRNEQRGYRGIAIFKDGVTL